MRSTPQDWRRWKRPTHSSAIAWSAGLLLSQFHNLHLHILKFYMNQPPRDRSLSTIRCSTSPSYLLSLNLKLKLVLTCHQFNLTRYITLPTFVSESPDDQLMPPIIQIFSKRSTVNYSPVKSISYNILVYINILHHCGKI